MRQESLKVYCLDHKTSQSIRPGETAALCRFGGQTHVLDTDFLHTNEWMFCCECNQYWIASKSTTANLRRCPACSAVGRPRFYTCDQCRTTMVDFGAAESQKGYRILPWGQPLPCCPGCLTPPDAIPYTHPCATLQGMLTSPRKQCAFCANPENKASNEVPISLGAESGATQTPIMIEEPKIQNSNAIESDASGAVEIAKRLAQLRLGGLPMDLGPAAEPEPEAQSIASAESQVPVNEIAKKLAQLRTSNPFQGAGEEEEFSQPQEPPAPVFAEREPVVSPPMQREERRTPIPPPERELRTPIPPPERYEPAPPPQMAAPPPSQRDLMAARERERERVTASAKLKSENTQARIQSQRTLDITSEDATEPVTLDEATLRKLDDQSMSKIDSLVAGVRERLKKKFASRSDSNRARVEAEMKFQQAEVLIRQIEEDFRTEIVRIRGEAEARVRRAEEEGRLRIARVSAETDARIQVLTQACEEAERRYAAAQSRAMEAESRAQNALDAQTDVERRLNEVEKRRKLPPPPGRPGLPA